ncbi:glycoside hydrolase family protein [Candidatus Magnetomonas plexicatena]|uniref:glycoside hydrolase family protein n=1 Tax=Candidatus Magnetomonas plexicatena TaxID=2552947 RepID=UPI001103DF0A|nr:lysozyme [Nitrospirales bacterium LBB_01]
MDFYKTLQNMLIRHEGLKLKAYKDTKGYLTIGVGRNLDTKGVSETEADSIESGLSVNDVLTKIKLSGINRETAMFLLENDIHDCEIQLKHHLSFYETLSDVRKIVLIDMCFNMGIGVLLGFKQTLHDIEVGNYESASRQMLQSQWAAQVHGRAMELSKMIKNDSIAENYIV